MQIEFRLAAFIMDFKNSKDKIDTSIFKKKEFYIKQDEH